jgi:hypothetical protein
MALPTPDRLFFAPGFPTGLGKMLARGARPSPPWTDPAILEKAFVPE